MSDDHSDDEGVDWEHSQEGRRAAIPPDVKQRIASAGWKFNRTNGAEVQITQVGKKDRLTLLEDLKTAGIGHKIDIKGIWNRSRKIVVNVHDLDGLVPEWRDTSYPEDIMNALVTAGWKYSKTTTDTAQVIIEGAGTLKALTENLDIFEIPYQVSSEGKRGPSVVTVKVADLDFIIPKWRTAGVPNEVKQDLAGAGWEFALHNDKSAFVGITHADELSALTALLDEANIPHMISPGRGPIQHIVTVDVEHLDRLLGDEWRHAAITPEIRERIVNTSWTIDKDEASFSSENTHEMSELSNSLQKAGMKFNYVSSYVPPFNQSIYIKTALLDKFVPEWRDMAAAKAIDDAHRSLRADAEIRAKAGKLWQEGVKPNKAIMQCKDQADARILTRLLDLAGIEYERQGQGGRMVQVFTADLRKAGIAVNAAVDVPVESEEMQKAGAVQWLRDRVQWETSKDDPSLAHAKFRNDDLLGIAIENLLILKCTKGLKRLPDNKGLILIVDANALKAAVEKVNIASYPHAQDASRGEDGAQKGM